ncbi:MAG: precorrin-6A reductase [Propionibacteriaceae bacterium]|jgi:precorrin-6x reductase|nr:precorrin-6A reductase [Propionibacteriaceae bacterium]
MVEVVIFGGTTESRELAGWCNDQAITSLVCVATELGEKVLPAMSGVTSQVGRLDRAGMIQLLRATSPQLVVDATHPYATVVTRTVVEVCAELGLRYVRVAREAGRAQAPGMPDSPAVVTVPDMASAVDWLAGTTGTIFATTGVNQAALLSKVPDFTERVVLRILPTVESVGACLDLGYPAKHLVAMQGPFDHNLNLALFRHFDTAIVVTKDSGDIGGFGDKLTAAAACGATTVVITRPIERGGVGLTEAQDIITQAVRS